MTANRSQDKYVDHHHNRSPLISIVLLSTSFLLVLMTAWGPTLEHLDDSSWSSHQQFHAFREIFMGTFFGLAGLYLCVFSLRRGGFSVLNKIAFLGVGLVMGFFFGLPVTGVGKSEIAPYINHGMQVVTLLLGYLTCYLRLSKNKLS